MHIKTFSTFMTLLLLASAASGHVGFADCKQFFARGQSPVATALPGKLRELCFEAFAVLHSGQSKTPVFVAERLNRTQLELARYERRANRFYEEARLPWGERAHLDDYRARLVVGASEIRFDRGHQAPAANMPNPEAMAQSFSLANVVPQAPENNRKAWANIEKATRKYIMRTPGDVFVITGPVFASDTQTLGPSQVWIPKYLYKLVYDTTRNRAWAHWIANDDAARPTHPISYEELVRRTGIEFLPGLHPQD